MATTRKNKPEPKGSGTNKQPLRIGIGVKPDPRTFFRDLTEEDRRILLNLRFEAHRNAFASGNRLALLNAICDAAAARLPLPEWARDELRLIQVGLISGHLSDPNEAFGWQKGGELHQGKRRAKAMKNSVLHDILRALWLDWIAHGKSETRPDCESIASDIRAKHKLTVADLGRPTVEDIWKQFECTIKMSPDTPPGNHLASTGAMWDWP